MTLCNWCDDYSLYCVALFKDFNQLLHWMVNYLISLEKQRVSSRFLKSHKTSFETPAILRGGHYHLQVQANPKKMAQKTDAIFSIFGKNGINP